MEDGNLKVTCQVKFQVYACTHVCIVTAHTYAMYMYMNIIYVL